MVRHLFLCGLMLVHSGILIAQRPATSWDVLQQLRPGDRIQVTDQKTKVWTGTFDNVSERVITLTGKSRASSIERVDVLRVKIRDTSNRSRRIILGTVIGAGIGLTIGLVGNAPLRNEGNGCSACVAGLTAGLGGLGAVLGMRPRYRTLYLASKPN